MERSANWKDILAAMVYLSTFLSISYGIYAYALGASFLKSVAVAYPLAFAASVLFFACHACFEALKKVRREDKRIVGHHYVPR